MKTNTAEALVKATQSMENLANAVRRDTLMAVLDECTEKIECYGRIMKNGRNIMETLSGYRFQRLYEKRLECWSFIRGLQAAQSLIISKL